MTLRGGLRVERPPWLTVHQIIGALILHNAGLVLVPLGGELLDAAPKIILGKASSRPFEALAARERTFGAASLGLALVTIFIAVLKPGLGRSRQ
jgi:hypothetical protein